MIGMMIDILTKTAACQDGQHHLVRIGKYTCHSRTGAYLEACETHVLGRAVRFKVHALRSDAPIQLPIS
jgi:hypothetical protein